MNKASLSHLALFTANLIYGINYTVAKDVMPDYVAPFGFIFLRAGGALLLFWLIHSVFHSEKIEKTDFIRLILCGVFGVAGNQLLFFKGLDITTPINAAIIMTSNPVLVLVIALILKQEKLSASKFAGIILGMAGALLLILFNSTFEWSTGTMPGDLMVFINALFYGAYLVLVKPLMIKYKPITVIKWVFLFGFIIVFPIGLEEVTMINWASFPDYIWYEVAFVVIGTTFIAYFLNIIALKNLSPSVVSTYIYLQPVLAALIAILANTDSLDWVKVFSTVLIFTGVYLVSRTKQPKVADG